MSGLPRVAVFTLGGTIASAADPGQAATVRLTGSELLKGLPEAGDIAEVEAHSVALLPSGDLRWPDLFELRSRIETAVRSGVQGVVVSQGTDTLEETSYALELMTKLDVPIVFTGAMRTSSTPGADGPANVLAAIRVAASSHARGLGTLVVVGDEIHASRHVRKCHSSSPSAFSSPGLGPVGYVSEDRVRMALRPRGRVHVAVSASAAPVPVAQMTVSFDDDGALIEAVPSVGYRGLVLAGLGGGHVPARLVPVVTKVAALIPVVLAPRTIAGEGLRGTYAYPGSETDLLARGLVSAGGVGALQAGILLRLMLMAGVRQDALAWCFEQATDPQGVVEVPIGGHRPPPLIV